MRNRAGQRVRRLLLAAVLLLGAVAVVVGVNTTGGQAAPKKPNPHWSSTATTATTQPGSTPPTTTLPTTTTLPPSGCTNPAVTITYPPDWNGGWPDGGYYVHNNVWNTGEAGPQTLYACAFDNWYVESTQPDTTSVKSYPNVHLDLPDAFGAGQPWDSYGTVGASFAGQAPGFGIYNVAFDLWLNGVGWGGGSTEVMIWTENHGQRPAGSPTTMFNAPDGLAYEVWHYYDGNANVVTYVSPVTQGAGVVDLKAFVDFGIGRGLIPPSPSLHQIGYGIEWCSTDNMPARFAVSTFSVALA